ncbi:MAG: hypothetical protein ACI32N_03355 [Bulleidia sp.]
MKKKTLKIIAFVTAVFLIIGLAVFANSLVGNPVSRWIAANAVTEYVQETYGDTDFIISSVSYNFKDGNYLARVESPSSKDTTFTIEVSQTGKIGYDWYEYVLRGESTANRLETGYRDMCDTILESSSFPYHRGDENSDIAFGTLCFGDPEYASEEEIYRKQYMKTEDLVLDGIYNISELGSQIGSLVIYVKEDTVSIERASEIILDIRSMFDQAGIGFHDMDFVLESETGEKEIRVSLLYEDIVEEGLYDRIIASDAGWKAYFSETDQIKQQEME